MIYVYVIICGFQGCFTVRETILDFFHAELSAKVNVLVLFSQMIESTCWLRSFSCLEELFALMEI